VEKERVIIERNNPNDATEVTPVAIDFNEGEVIRIEVYEETARSDRTSRTPRLPKSAGGVDARQPGTSGNLPRDV